MVGRYFCVFAWETQIIGGFVEWEVQGWGPAVRAAQQQPPWLGLGEGLSAGFGVR